MAVGCVFTALINASLHIQELSIFNYSHVSFPYFLVMIFHQIGDNDTSNGAVHMLFINLRDFIR